MATLRLMTTSGKLRELARAEVSSASEARKRVEAYAKEHGMSNVVAHNELDVNDCVRYTATTHGGRAGRNIAYLEYDTSYSDYVKRDERATDAAIDAACESAPDEDE